MPCAIGVLLPDEMATPDLPANTPKTVKVFKLNRVSDNDILNYKNALNITKNFLDYVLGFYLKVKAFKA